MVITSVLELQVSPTLLEVMPELQILIPKSFFLYSLLGYPEGHADSPDKFADINYLVEKQEAGADFVVTQLFYDVDVFISWYKACRARGRK